ncbi:MAG: ABC transporter permease, partial [Pseudomonadota bacterium]
MDPLTWTGPLGQILDPVFGILAALFALAVVVQIAMSVASAGERVVTNPDGTLSSSGGAYGTSRMATKYTGLALLIVIVAYLALGAVGGPGLVGIV